MVFPSRASSPWSSSRRDRIESAARPGYRSASPHAESYRQGRQRRQARDPVADLSVKKHRLAVLRARECAIAPA